MILITTVKVTITFSHFHPSAIFAGKAEALLPLRFKLKMRTSGVEKGVSYLSLQLGCQVDQIGLIQPWQS
jgi:hypothetical protein